MAGSLALNVEILGQFSKLTAATQGATGTLTRLGTSAKKISRTMNNAFRTVGVGFSLALLINAFKEASQAAIADAKSMEILEIAMINTGEATRFHVEQAEASITAMSLQTGIADDDLRPAFQKLFIATENVEEANRLLAIALDTSAATGKDLDAVTQAMSRALNGNETALNRLVPSLKGVDDPLTQLGITFKGAAEAAANLDPYQRMNVAFGEIQESVGSILQPVLNDFADYLVDAVPKIQDFFEELQDPSTDLGKSWQRLGRTFKKTGDQFNKLLGAFGVSGISFESVLDFVTALSAGFGQLFFFVTQVTKIISALLRLDFAEAFSLAGNFGAAYNAFVNAQNEAINPTPELNPNIPQGARSITINVNNGNVTAEQIAKAINKADKSTGTSLIRRK
jgi:hypothetical protein